MHFRVTHTKSYRYSQPVFLEPHALRMKPRQDPYQRLASYEMAIEPAPAGQTEILDANGNSATLAWFDGQSDHMAVTVSFEVETLLTNPFDYLLASEENLRLPMQYGGLTASLIACRERPTEMDSVVRFAAGIAEEANGRAIDFVNLLNTRIYKTLEQEVREDGPAHPADETLARGAGTCRDAAVLFNAACRAVGIAARFVSGYQEGDRDQDLRHLHAWSEVYLPHAGWRGYDPTHGLVVSDRHVALAAAPEPIGAMPLTGSFRGTGATWEMAYDLQIEVDG